MRAMILAAGRGERMRPLTDHCPKPLLPVAGVPLIVWHLRKLRQAGIIDVVINHAHLGTIIEAALGDGVQFGLKIRYSAEHEALESAGGIAYALPLLGEQPFLLINGDIYCNWPLTRAYSIAEQMRVGGLRSWCVLVANPQHNPKGDFALDSGQLLNDTRSALNGRHTYAGIGVFAPALFDSIARGAKAALAPLLRQAAERGQAGAEFYDGLWVDVGTPQRLAELDNYLKSESIAQGEQ